MSVIHVEVRGRVQGVGFRWFIVEQARELGLAGWVRNLETGGVEVAASGPDGAVTELLGVLRRGPPGAVIRDVVTFDTGSVRDLAEPFRVVR